LVLEWASVFLAGLCLGLSVAILVVLWRVWGNTDRAEQDGKERLEMLREQQERLHHLHEERRILLEELERLREQQERLRWLREGRVGLLAELKRLRSLVEEEAKRADALEARFRATPSASTERRLRLAGDEELSNGNGHGHNGNRHNGPPEAARGAQTPILPDAGKTENTS
jgi:hypothetical protein